jgi:hypothetical protein
MPWKTTTPMEEALRFVTLAQTERFTLTELCGRLVSGKSINVSRPDPFGLCCFLRNRNRGIYRNWLHRFVRLIFLLLVSVQVANLTE